MNQRRVRYNRETLSEAADQGKRTGDLESTKKVKIAGAMYDLATAKVEFFS